MEMIGQLHTLAAFSPSTGERDPSTHLIGGWGAIELVWMQW